MGSGNPDFSISTGERPRRWVYFFRLSCWYLRRFISETSAFAHSISSAADIGSPPETSGRKHFVSLSSWADPADLHSRPPDPAEPASGGASFVSVARHQGRNRPRFATRIAVISAWAEGGSVGQLSMRARKRTSAGAAAPLSAPPDSDLSCFPEVSGPCSGPASPTDPGRFLAVFCGKGDDGRLTPATWSGLFVVLLGAATTFSSANRV